MLSVVCWKWRGTREYESHYVNVLRQAVEENLHIEHEFVCVTDDPEGLDERIRVVPLPPFEHLPVRKGFPSCYIRLWAFDPEFAKKLGKRILTIDIDVIITGDLTPLVDRNDDFVIWCDSDDLSRIQYQGGLYLMDAGARPEVWTKFKGMDSLPEIKASGLVGSDQAWISMCLYPHEKTWDRSDGVYKHRHIGKSIPADSRIVLPTGVMKPWSNYVKDKFPEYYKLWSKNERVMWINTRNYFDGTRMQIAGEQNPNPSKHIIARGLVKEVKVAKPDETKTVKKAVKRAKRKPKNATKQNSKLD